MQFRCRDYTLELGKKTYIMGILNVTPDSFSDGGRYNTPEPAEERALRLVADGADIIDIGGESTRPGFTPVDTAEELRRVIPVVERLTAALSVPLSVDTTKPEVAQAALEAGAHIINDIWGFQKEAALARITAAFNAGAVLMHNSESGVYENGLMAGIGVFLRASTQAALQAGVQKENIIIDPGIGFGKDLNQNIEVMRRLGELRELGFPLLTGTSRKSLIGKTLNLPPHDRLEGTAATVAVSITGGADFVRVHDVKEMKRVAAMTDAIARPGG